MYAEKSENTSSRKNIIRTRFIRKVYLHLLLAIVAFVGLEYLWFSTGVAHSIYELMKGWNWLIVLGMFMTASWVASRLGSCSQTKSVQYAGFSLYVVAQSLIFLPLLFLAESYAKGGVIREAGYITLVAFISLTVTVFLTNMKLVGWGKYFVWGGIIALVAIVAGAIFGFQLGTYFSVLMVGFSGVAILYDTSRILHTYDDDSYVCSAMHLFASVTLIFWYVFRSRK